MQVLHNLVYSDSDFVAKSPGMESQPHRAAIVLENHTGITQTGCVRNVDHFNKQVRPDIKPSLYMDHQALCLSSFWVIVGEMRAYTQKHASLVWPRPSDNRRFDRLVRGIHIGTIETGVVCVLFCVWLFYLCFVLVLGRPCIEELFLQSHRVA